MKKINVSWEFLKKAPDNKLLYHQYRTIKALKENSIVFNTYPTGAGKTRASLEWLKENQKKDVLFIAPTNELIRQHYEDVSEFVDKNKLDYCVIRIDANVLKEVKATIKTEKNIRNGELLNEIIRNPFQYSDVFKLNEIKEKTIIIVNPDIFYYCLYGFYNKLDKANLMESMITKFNYIIIDEFHYYNSKQLANFLFFILLLKNFNYFDGTKKVCILTATPDKLVEEYLKRGKVDYKIISPENEPKESEEYEKIKTLSKMELIISDKNLEEVVEEEYKNILDKDCAIISQSLFKVNSIKQRLKILDPKNKDIGIITGAVPSFERKMAVNKKIIIATTTVDIGYNFKKLGKEGQNIDIVITEAETSDQALQRIGRAGRILGKKKQDDICKVILCVDKDIYNKFENVENEISRKDLKELIEKNIPKRNIMKKYLSSGGILELGFPIEELNKKFEYKEREKIVGGLFNNLVSVFAPKKNFSFREIIDIIKKYKKQLNFLSLYKNSDNKNDFIISEDNSSIINDDLIVDVMNEFFVNLKNNKPFKKEELELYSSEQINKFKQEAKNEIVEYLEKSICKIKYLTSFRGNNLSANIFVYDKNQIFLQQEKTFKYDIFHLIKYYKLYWYKDKSELLYDLNKDKILYDKDILNDCTFFVRVEELLEKALTIKYSISSNEDKEKFEGKFKDDIGVIKGLKIVLIDKKTEIRQYIPEEVTNYLYDQYIPILLVKSSEEYYQISKIIKNQPIFFSELNVSFINEENKKYQIITGSNALFVNYEIIRLMDNRKYDEGFIF